MRKTLAFLFALTVAANGAAFAQTPSPALKIVVIEGEDAVNIIQQKTAVAPIVEVRDRNNLPVSGASVTFAVTGPGASFAGGAPAITVVTNAAGQATAAGLTPTAAGAVHVSATATFEGQTAIATITQSNVMTAAEAVSTTAGATSGTGGGAGTSTGAGAAGGGGGGGLSATTIGIIGAAAGGGALVAATAAGGGNEPSVSTGGTTVPTAPTTTSPTTSPSPTTPPATPQPSSAAYSGPVDGTFAGTSTVTITGEPNFSCTFSMRTTGTANMRLQTTAAGQITGTLEMSGRNVITTSTCGAVGGVIGDEPFANTATVEGSAGTIRFTQEFRDSGTAEGASWTTTASVSFTGTVSSSGVTGTLTYNTVGDVRGDGFSSRATWTGSIPLTLR